MRTTTRLRQMIQEPGIIVVPGVYDCLTAIIAQQAGFPAVCTTGAGASVAHLGYPDLALATMTEIVANSADIAARVEVPIIADADTGYGGILNVQRTVRQFERAGVAAILLEDQEFPKRCGHLDDKRVIPAADMGQKLRAAIDARTDPDFTIIARTDALAVTGWDDTLRRCEHYVEAGAHVLFVEAVETLEQVEKLAKSFDVPLLYNCAENTKSPLIPAAELERLGFKLAIFPNSTLTMVCGVVANLMRELKRLGTTAHLADQMVSLQDCFDTVGISKMLAEEARYAPEPKPAG